GVEQLGPDEDGEQTADAEEDERGDQVQVPDHLVVGGGDPRDHGLAQRPAFVPQARDRRLLRRGLRRGVFLDSHQLSAPSSAVGSSMSAACSRSSSGPRSPVWPAASRSAMCCSYSSADTTATLNNMYPWYSPHSSAHLPR